MSSSPQVFVVVVYSGPPGGANDGRYVDGTGQASAGGQLHGFGGQGSDLFEITGGDHVFGHHPGAADCQHARQRQIVTQVGRPDPTGGHELHLRERSGQRLDGRRTTAGAGGEVLDRPQSGFQRGLDLGGGHSAGQGQYAAFGSAADHRLGQARGDDVLGTRVHRCINLVRAEYGTGAEQHVTAGCDRLDRRQCSLGAEGDFGNGEAAGDEGLGQGGGIDRVLQYDDGNEARLTQLLE